ncbi:MAG TPA: ABC transporter permease [Polyangia bacterium]|jgi:putative ABC transport system permease protein
MWLEYLRIALGVLRSHKSRSALTVLSITIGAFSIVLMTSLADSGLKTLWQGIEEIGGARLIGIWRKQPDAMESKQLSYGRGLTRFDVEALGDIPHLGEITQMVALRGKGMQTDTGAQGAGDIVGADQRFLGFFHYRIAQGRRLDRDDVQNHTRVAVIGDDLADKLFGKGEQVIGRTVTIFGMHYRIVGRLAKLDRWGVGFGWKWDEILAVPIETLVDHARKEAEARRQVWMLTTDPTHNEIVKRIMNARLMDRHHGVDDFAIFDFEKRIAGFLQIFLIMKVIVGLLASIALLVGGVGIMNIMLVSVSERVREIGIRKALGASPSDIGRQFLVEAILLSTIGGAVGVGAGIGSALGACALIRHFKPTWVTAVSQPAVVAAVVVALLIGLVFGYFPARRASRLDPVQAIRA